jgi:hypothetical protein
MRLPRHHTWSSLSPGEAVDAISVKEKHPVQIQGQLDPSRYNLKMDKCLGGTALLWIQEHGRELMQGEQIRVSSDRHTDDSPSPTTETDTPAVRTSTR